jgi:effector-binding domain-containing protein
MEQILLLQLGVVGVQIVSNHKFVEVVAEVSHFSVVKNFSQLSSLSTVIFYENITMTGGGPSVFGKNCPMSECGRGGTG